MEKYFTKYDTESAYQNDANNLPSPNVSLIEQTENIKTKKFVPKVNN